MTLSKCKKCGEFMWNKILGDAHRCCPLWQVWALDRCDVFDGRKIHASTPSSAAEKWAKIDDWETVEFSIAKGNDETVCVVAWHEFDESSVEWTGSGEAPESVTVHKFTVSGRSEPIYTATEVKS